MRNYSGYSDRRTEIDVGETHVTVRESSGRVRTAAILEKKTDAAGRVTSLLLDRIIHERYERIAGWSAGGCFVTELVAEGA